MKNEITIIIPAYNEEEGIKPTILECIKHAPDAKILIIDDNSSDKTNKIVKDMIKKYKQIKIVKNKENLNYGGALKVGYKTFKTPYMVFLDADGTYPPRYIPKLLKFIKSKKLDVVWGTRFSKQEKSHMPFIRKLGNRILRVIFFVWTGKALPDICSGMRLFTREGIEKIDYQTLPRGLDMITAMTKRIVKRKLKFGIMPIFYANREGPSKLNAVKDFIRMTRNILFEK